MSGGSALTFVYIPADNEEDVYVEAQLIDSDETAYLLRLEDGSTIEIPQNVCLPAPVLPMDGEQDMIFLEHLNEGSLLHNLRKRHSREHIYTYTGSILMSVNPYKMLPIYTPSIKRAYAGHGLGIKGPHVFAIADVCYRAILSENINQSVLISGESGAGKTEAAKSIMSYLAFVSENEAIKERLVMSASSESHSNQRVLPHEKVLATNPVLEAFGNAKTVRNDNSSRFGKMLDVQFDCTGFLVGACIRQYLLEEVRVIHQSEHERNFHIFYYVCAGVDKTERERFAITEPSDYHFTNQSGMYELPGVNSKYMYIELKRALGIAGVSPPEIFNVMKLMSAILWLSNVEFEGEDENSTRVIDTSVLNWAALLLDVSPANLKKALISRENKIRNEQFIVPVSAEKARVRRDTLAKKIYQRNFEWIVRRLNENIDANIVNVVQVVDEDSKEEKENSNNNNSRNNSRQPQRKGNNAEIVEDCEAVAHHLLLLDIFGFEVFEENYFEQFCINFANERLQFEFNEHIFRLEQQVYKSENIDITAFTYSDNKPCIHLIEKKPQGILWLLDEQSRFPQSTDKSFYEKICAVHKKRSKKTFVQPRFSKYEIIIKHYAGDVMYDTRGFLEKTKRVFGLQMLRLMKESNSHQYCNLFQNDSIEQSNTSKNKRRCVCICISTICMYIYYDVYD